MTEAGSQKIKWVERGMVQCLARHQSKGQEAGGMWVMSKSEAEMNLLDRMDDCYSQQCYIASCLPSCRLPPTLKPVINPQPLRAFSYLLKGNSKIARPTTLYDLASGSLFNYIFHHSFPSLSNHPVWPACYPTNIPQILEACSHFKNPTVTLPLA